MSHQRYPSEVAKEPHSISLKVIRLSRPSLVTQHAYASPCVSDLSTTTTTHPAHPAQLTKANPASLAYATDLGIGETNPEPFVLSPILNLPPSFGTAYVGETFACALCANHEVMMGTEGGTAAGAGGRRKDVMDLRIEAEMKTPGSLSASAVSTAGGGGTGVIKLKLVGMDGIPQAPTSGTTTTGVAAAVAAEAGSAEGAEGAGVTAEIIPPGKTVQRNLFFELKEEGNHVLAVTVSYYEKTETSGRSRTFRKLYQFMCKGSVVVRTKCTAYPSVFPMATAAGPGVKEGEDGGIPPAVPAKPGGGKGKKNETTETERLKGKGKGKGKEKGGQGEGDRLKWILEAQLENCSEEVMQLERVMLDLVPGLKSRNCNWPDNEKPVLHPMEVEQVAFVVEEEDEGRAPVMQDGRIAFGMLGIGWRNEMGNRGFLNTGKLVARVK